MTTHPTTALCYSLQYSNYVESDVDNDRKKISISNIGENTRNIAS